MHPNISILPSTRIPSTQRIHSHCIQGSKMPFYAPDLVFEDFVVEAGFEFSLAGAGCCHVHGCLAATEDYEGFLWGDCGGV